MSDSPTGSAAADAPTGSFPPPTLTGCDAPVQLREPEEAPPTAAPPGGAAQEPAASAAAVPLRLDRYDVLGEIAHGGMGVVYKVRDPKLGRTLALKVLLDCHGQRPDLRRRFLEEAQIGGQLQHPGLVSVHELGSLEDQRPFFTMKLVKGRTLAELLRERAAPAADLPRFLGIFEQVCQTLAYAHSRGVIHRDLKPANVMVGAFGEIQVMDWGLAKVLGQQPAALAPATAAGTSTLYSSRLSTADESATRAGTVLGTPAYMPPEQARGQVDHLDERCDVFGLGALLCEMLTGQPPYAGPPERVLAQAAQGDLAEAHGRLERCGADAELVRLALRCLAFQPLERPAHAGAVAEAVTAYRAGVEARLRQAEVDGAAARARAAEERKRRRLTLALAGSVLLTVLLGSGGWLWISQERAAREREELEEQTQRERAALADREQRERAARDQQAAAARQLQTVLARAEERRARARASNDAARWAEARTLAEQAETLLAGVSDPELGGRVRALRRELEDEEKDRQLLVRLERLWQERLLTEYRRVFGEHGFRPQKLSAQDAADWVRRRPPETRARLIAGLDAWMVLAPYRGPERDALFRVLQAADDNGPRKELRAAVAKNDLAAVERLTTPEALERQGPETVLLLAGYLQTRKLNRAIAVLRSAYARFPGDYWIVVTLARALEDRNTYELAEAAAYEEEVRFRTAALALRPDSHDALLTLGHALASRKRFDEALAVLKRATERQPADPYGWVALAWALQEQGRFKEAEGAVRRALQLKRTSNAESVLGLIFFGQGRYDEAVAAAHRGLRLYPTAEGHLGLAALLWRKGRLDESAWELQKALHWQNDLLAAKFLLQLHVYEKQGRSKDAETLCRTATLLQPQNPSTHLALYICLVTQGRFAETPPVIKRCADLAAQTPNIHSFPKLAVRETEQILALEPQLAAFLKGELKPRDAAERDLLLYLCWAKRRYAGAARLYTDAFAADPKLADDLRAEHRCDAARSAARAAAGLGDGSALAEKERTRLRKLAVQWLRDDLAARAKQLQAVDPDERADAAERLRWWRWDPALAGVRDAAALQQLPTAERQACQQFWADVAALVR